MYTPDPDHWGVRELETVATVSLLVKTMQHVFIKIHLVHNDISLYFPIRLYVMLKEKKERGSLLSVFVQTCVYYFFSKALFSFRVASICIKRSSQRALDG